MMNYLKNITLCLFIILLSSCGKDDFMEPGDPDFVVVNEQITGTVFIDNDNDGIADDPFSEAIIYYADSIYQEYEVSWDMDPDILTTTIDSFGNYTFNGVPPAQGKALFIATRAGNNLYNIVGVDDESDGDQNEEHLDSKIHIDIDNDEVDAGNNFLLTSVPVSLISGSLLLDDDEDGIGDVPLSSYYLKLYTRLPSGLPSTNLVATTSTWNGVYEFLDVDPGEYIIEVRDTTFYNVFSSGDDSPDADPIGDPSLPNLIPVDLDVLEEDTDNNYILRNKVTGTISGFITDPDLGLAMKGITLKLLDASTGAEISNTISSSNGTYSFTAAIGNYTIVLSDAADFVIAAAGDSSDDGDPFDEQITQNNEIDVVLEANEVDADNVFVITVEAGRVSGRVLLDSDNNGIGDTPLADEILFIHYRGATGAPMGINGLEMTQTDANGYYDFDTGIPDAGEFVIYFIGSGNPPYECISSEDLSPEAGEPQNQHPQCQFIQVDLSTGGSVDHNNVYILK